MSHLYMSTSTRTSPRMFNLLPDFCSLISLTFQIGPSISKFNQLQAENVGRPLTTLVQDYYYSEFYSTNVGLHYATIAFPTAISSEHGGSLESLLARTLA